jgi:hypothetical protein
LSQYSFFKFKDLMSKGGIEPPTHGFSVHCSTSELFRLLFM